MDNSRFHILAVYQTFKKYSDINHPLTAQQLLHYLKIEFDITMHRGTLRNYIQALQDFGIEIVDADRIKDGKYLLERQFEESEIYLLSHAVHSSHFIPSKASSHLIHKLLDTQSKYFKHNFHNSVYIENGKKNNNPDFFYTIEMLLTAIHQKKGVSFQYMQYDYNKRLVPKREKPYKVYPYFVVSENDNIYLICKSLSHLDTFSHYRIDKIKNVQMIQESTPSLQKNFDPYEYTYPRKFMFSDEIETVYLKCHVRILDDIIEQFGKTIQIVPIKNEDYFHVRMKTSRQGIIYFAMQYLAYCEILSPDNIRNKLKEILVDATKKYQI